MGNKQARNLSDRVETAKKTGVFSMAGGKYAEIPVKVMELAPTARTVDLSDNKLSTVPVALGNFIRLKQLLMDCNKIDNLPKELCRMTKLEVLQLGHNLLTSIPSTFGKFENLVTLNLQANQLAVFPGCLCELKSIDTVDLSQNQINELPKNMETFQAIELNMNQNKLRSLHSSLNSCPRLKVLRLEENVLELSEITTEFLRDSQVSVLAVDGNMFQMRELHGKDGYDQYLERFTATKKKYIS